MLPENVKLAYAAWARGAIQKPTELAELIALLHPRRPCSVVEIGTAGGGTLYVWCQVAHPSAIIVSIDLPGGPFGGGIQPAEIATLRSYGLPQQELRFLLADSHDPSTKAELEGILHDSPIEFLMIDGDHTYEGVKRDFELYSPLVAVDGLIAFHDIVPHATETGCEVDRFWNEVRQGQQHLEIVDPGSEADSTSQWGGIGLIRWRFTPPS
jgi:cephalosporin hydroxylase